MNATEVLPLDPPQIATPCLAILPQSGVKNHRATNGKRSRFTAETAKAAAELSRQRRAAIREANAMLAKEAAEARAKLAATTPQSGRIAAQIRRLEDMIAEADDADSLQKLTAAHARLFKAWQVLTGTPDPGSRRGKGALPRTSVGLEPVGPATDGAK